MWSHQEGCMNNKFLGIKIFGLLILTSSAFAGSFDGHWYVTKMECNGERASEATANHYRPPNSITVNIQGSNGAFIDDVNGCQKIIPLLFNYPSPTLMTASFSGPIQCAPESCDSACGQLLPISVAYEVFRRNNTLIWNSIGPIDDNCAKGGQTDPITYYMHVR